MKIYCIENHINHHRYIGKTIKSIDKRFNDHVNQALKGKRKFSLHHAMVKYGIINFSIIEIDSANTLGELNEKEIYWINQLDTKNNGYNEREGGNGGAWDFTDEQKQKISTSVQNYYKNQSEEEKLNQSLKTKEYWENLSEEEKEKRRLQMSQILQGNQRALGMTYSHSDTAKESIRQARLGKHHSIETRTKISNIRKGTPINLDPVVKEEKNRKIGESKKGRKRIYREDGTFYMSKLGA